MKMKFNQLLFIMFIKIITMLSIFIFDLLNSLNADNFVNLTNEHFNQISARDVKNATSTLTSSINKTTSTNIDFNNGSYSPVGWILAVSFCGALLVVVGAGLY